ncbi:MAG TPA: hypothetical protein VGC54_02740, partial [Planctomycetota bacterium]
RLGHVAYPSPQGALTDLSVCQHQGYAALAFSSRATTFDHISHPLAVGPEVFNRDMLVVAALTLSLFVIGYGFRGPGRINRIEGAVLLVCYVGYTAYLVSTVFGGQA